jgi:3-deoxy-D-manno-octulosonic acid kinase
MTLNYITHGLYTIGTNRQLTLRHLDQLAGGFQSSDRAAVGTLGGRRSITRLHLDTIGPVIIKHFCRGGLLAHLVHRTYFRVGKTRGQGEFEQMVRFRQLGVQTPDPVAFAYKGGLFYTTWLVTQEIQSVQSMAQLSRTAPHRVAQALGELARQVAILIDHGVLHADFHPGNVLIDDQDHVYVIDLDKARTFSGSQAKLRSRYHRRWCRAVRKHGLPAALCEFPADDQLASYGKT